MDESAAGKGGGFLLCTLGRLELIELSRGTEGSPLLQRGKPLALLVYCTSDRRRAHPRDVLCALLWADAAPERARHNVRQALWRLRRVLGELLVTRDDAVMSVAPEVVTDRDQFLEAIARHDVLDALALYRGPFLDGLSFPGGDEFEEWVSAERRRMEDALVRIVDASRRDGSRLRAADRRNAAELLTDRAPDSPEARRVAIDLLLDLGDLTGARREADNLEALTLRLGVPLTATMRASIDAARTVSEDAEQDAANVIALDLVGRDEPFSSAMNAWSKARRGEAELLIFSGVTGVGKTRLLEAIAQRIDRRRALVVCVRAHVGEQDVPFGFAALLARVLARQPGAAGISAESARELIALDPGLASLYHALPAPVDTTEGTRRRALALLDLLQAVAEQQPLALLIDDLHWVDGPSRHVLAIAIGRLTDSRLLTIATTRPGAGHGLQHPTLTTVALLPLEAESVMDAILSSGSWPVDGVADAFVQALAGACEGIPLNVVERLTLALDAGWITRSHGLWSAPDWQHATQEIAVSSPLRRRLQSCTAHERDWLLRLAVAGAPLAREILAAEPAVLATLRSLEAKGFVRIEQDHWTMVHDAIVEQLLAHSTTAEIQAAHQELARALVRSRSADRLSTAVRHFHLGGDDVQAGALFSDLVSRARGRGDRRTARQLLTDTLGELAPMASQQVILRAVPWHQRERRTATRALTAAAFIIAVASTSLAWRDTQTPSLRLSQTSLVVTHAWLLGEDAYRLIPPVIVATSQEEGVDSTARVVRAVARDSTTRILTGSTVTTKDGVARFGGLRVATTDSIVRMRFESDGFRAVDLSIPVGIVQDPTAGDGSIHLVGARFDGVREASGLAGPEATITVDRGAAIRGVVQMEYSAPWAAASVWVSMTPNWGEPRAVGRELFPVTTPVRWDVADVPIAATAPLAPGRYWILVVLAAEPSGGFSLSATNWSMGAPIWDDGNELALLPDSIIHAANRTGLARTFLAYSADHPNLSTLCKRRGRPGIHYCTPNVGMLGIRVIVR